MSELMPISNRVMHVAYLPYCRIKLAVVHLLLN